MMIERKDRHKTGHSASLLRRSGNPDLAKPYFAAPRASGGSLVHTSLRPNPVTWPELMERIRHHSPDWAARLAQAKTRQELQELVSGFLHDLRLVRRLATASDPVRHGPSQSAELAEAIHRFLIENLPHGPTLKGLAKFLGYSEKYCSDLFQSIMGEQFSRCIKRLRVERATQLLLETESPQTRIAERLGFSDQFTFSHFFKRAVGCSPQHFRLRARNTRSPRRNG